MALRGAAGILRLPAQAVASGQGGGGCQTVDLDPAKLGYHDFVIVQLTLESHTDETLYEFGRVLAGIPEIQEAYLVSGDYDYYIRIAVRETRDYERLLREKLNQIPGIRHSKSSFVLRVLKEASVPLHG